jgi:exo beta-1,2-glucooligosaccharide sophorohydrolase (non-reducing end)
MPCQRWRSPLLLLPGELQFYKIYRSLDGKAFTPLATQRGDRTRFEDFLGASGKNASYKVSAVNSSYKESALSETISGSTRAMSDDELLTMVQEACFRYYWEAAHPNAGMAIEILPGDKNLVGLGSSGFGIMAIVAGLEGGFITREQGVERLEKNAFYVDRRPVSRRLATFSGRAHRQSDSLLR